jgi:hypothetical protein
MKIADFLKIMYSISASKFLHLPLSPLLVKDQVRVLDNFVQGIWISNELTVEICAVHIIVSVCQIEEESRMLMLSLSVEHLHVRMRWGKRGCLGLGKGPSGADIWGS